MTENTAEQPTDSPQLFDAPDDVAETEATGWAVYDRTLGRFVGGKLTDKPTSSAASKLVDEGHSTKVVRV